MLTEDQAVAEVKRFCAPTSEPAVTDAEVLACVQGAARAKVWEAGADYAVGDRVIVGNGRVYTCAVAGTSGIEFPAILASSINSSWLVGDGSARWKDSGPAHPEQFDVKAAISAVWLMKAGKAAEQITFAQDGKRYELSNLQAQCLRMAAKYQPVVVA